MADYYPLIARAIARLDPSGPGESRRALYEQARAALIAQLRSAQPPLSESEITRERQSLEEAIRKVESEAVQRARDASRAGARAGDSFRATTYPNSTPSEPASQQRNERPPTGLGNRLRPNAPSPPFPPQVPMQDPQLPPTRERSVAPRRGPDSSAPQAPRMRGFRDIAADADDLGRAAAQANRAARKTHANVPSPSPEFDRLVLNMENRGTDPDAPYSYDESAEEAMRHQAPPQNTEAEKQNTNSAKNVNTTITVWYGTNRRPIDDRYPQRGFSSEHDTRIHYGTCKILIPESHKIGSIGTSWIRRFLSRVDDRLRILSVKALHEQDYWRGLKTYFETLESSERHAIVFVHGYNVSFYGAARRAAQIGCDLSVKGATAFFSWPSQGTYDGYFADEAAIEASEPYLTEFLYKFACESGASKVHLIVHSMGNRGVLRAVSKIATLFERDRRFGYGQIVLAAADVNAGTFRNLCNSYVSVALQTTLYVCVRDRAVGVSRRLHNSSRVGVVPPVTVVPGIITIGVTNTDLTLLGQGYVGEARGVLQDIHNLIMRNASPDQRSALRRQTTDTGEPFWIIGK